MDIDILCSNLEKAFNEQSDDPVTLATIIDMYVSQINEEGTRDNKKEFLTTLLELLKANPDIVRSIGWDLPKDLLKFYNKGSVTVSARLNSNPIVGLVMKCFNEVALSGNPKECLLTGCELLSELTATRIAGQLEEEDEDNTEEEEENLENAELHRDPVEFFLFLNSYVLFELIQTVLKRINSLYPSKFLGMAVSAITKFVRANIDDIFNAAFILRRIYTFCKSYIPPEMPKELLADDKLKKEDLDRISADEAALQGQLLRSLCAFAMGYCLKNKPTKLDLEYYHRLRNTQCKIPEYNEELLSIGKRFYQLTFAFDLDIKEQFLSYIKETKGIYKALPPDTEIPNEEARRAIGQVVYQLAYTYQLQKLTKLKHLELNPNGIFNLSGLHYEETGKHLYPEISMIDAIYLFIRCTTPALFSQTYSNEYCKGTARYWVWVAITNNSFKDLCQQMNELPTYIRTVFLQMILLQNCNQPNEETRMITFTLLTRIMCLMPEDTSFDFVLDTLLTCPFIHAKIAVLGILKDLMLRNCQSKQSLEEQLSNLDLQPKETDENENAKSSPPSLPPRPYVTVNEDRMASIHSVAIMTIQDEKTKGKDHHILILNFLNFFNGLSQKWDKNLLEDIHSQVASHYNEGTEETIPEVGFVKIANDTLKKHL
ncbi:YBP1 (YBR216C) and YBP2 (YGL060W) [Zygosaccharomyces parabailii]|nr:YBP1 (YBR216C) and YBP2 (YGL060W) [Zygosaccharomyces parabailii]CDH10127.1 related to YAP1-binding protein 1 [Zygosaccharomyces bailii ISA1307]